jgi:aspartate racemase
LEKIIPTGKELCRLGVDLIAIPCVTSHYFYDEISSAFSVPVVNMLKETALTLEENNVKCAGIMATSGTVSTKLFQNTLKMHNIESVVPDREIQEDVMHLIYKCVKAGKPIDMNRYKKVSEHLFQKGAEKIILGCTELAVLNRLPDPPKDTVCALDILAKACLNKLGVKIKQ